MALKSKLFAVTLLLSLLFLRACAALEDDPELKQCKHQCRHQQGFDEDERQQCGQRCDGYIRQKEEEQRRRGEQRGPGEEEEEFEGGQRQGRNPYLFQEEHFEAQVHTEAGRVQILQKFTERSNLLRGIEDYRIGYLVAEPLAFVAPTHLDADCVLFVAQGRATVTLVRGEKKESHNLKVGDLFRIKAGTPVYMMNRDEKEKLFIVKFLKTVSTPGEYEAFYAAGGEDPESFFRAFSPQVLQAAFKTDLNRLGRLFGQQKQGSILRASKEQIQQLSQHHGQGAGFWPFGESSSSDSFNLLKKHPSQSNKFGRLMEADFNDFEQLHDLNLLVSFANITQGSMVGPFFNSRATKIAFVVDGEGYFEMACPHVDSTGRQKDHHRGSSSQQRPMSSPIYQKISGQLRRGVVFVAPAGHPMTAIASRNRNLQIVCFDVNARDNVKYPLVGKKNVVSQFDREAKELAFNVPAREVDRIFNSQQDEFFFEGPKEQPEHGRAYA